jgi:hypothetical protein
MKTTGLGSGDIAEVVEYLYEDLDSIPSSEKKIQNEFTSFTPYVTEFLG